MAGGAGWFGEVVGKSGSRCPTARTAGGCRANKSEIDFHPTWVFTTGSEMADMGRGGTVVVLRPHYRSWGLCTCGWVAKPCVLLSSATVEALIHAARHGCMPAVPLIQPGVMMIVQRRGILDVDGRQGGGQPSSNRRRRAVPHSAANLVQLIDAAVTADLLQLTNIDFTSNAIALERDGQFPEWVVTGSDIQRCAPTFSESQGS
jgi:hypothetical protein